MRLGIGVLQSPLPHWKTPMSRSVVDDSPLADGAALSGDRLRRTLSLVTWAWVSGSIWLTATSGAPLTLFAQGLGASKFEFGLLAAMPFMASLLSLPASLLIDRTGQRRRIFLWALFCQRLMWLPIAGLPLWMVSPWGYGPGATGPAMGLFLMLTLSMHAGQAIGGPAWVSWMADVVPDRLRGKYFARRRQWGILSAIPTALLVGWLLDRLHPNASDPAFRTMAWCAGIFMVAAVFGVVDIATFIFVPDVPVAPRNDRPLLQGLMRPLRDRQYLWFAGFVATLVFAVSFMGQFVTLYLIERLGVTNTQTQLMLIVAPSLAQLAVLGVWGVAADRMGKKPVLVLAALGLVPVGVAWCFMGDGSFWLGYVLSALGAALWAGVDVSNMNMVLEMSASKSVDDPDQEAGGSAYVAVNSIIINIAGCLGGLSSGLIAQALRDWHWTPVAGWKTLSFYEVLFALSAFMRLLAVVVFLPRIHETRAKPTVHVLRFMTTNIYNNVFNALMQPVRRVRRMGERR